MGNHGQTRVFGHSTREVVSIGLKRRPLADLYHRLVTGTWTRLCAVYAVAYFAASLLFSAAHWAVGDAGAVPKGSFVGAVVALVRGVPLEEVRGAFALRSLAAGALDGVEGFVWWLLLVIGAGIVLAKFALLKARVLFSEVAVVSPAGRGTALLFRMANERNGHVVDAKVQVMLVRNAIDEDGELVRRAFDVPLVRGGTALFAHAWTAVHEIDARSPLAGDTEVSLARDEAELLVTFSGYDEGLLRVINARAVYPAERIYFGARFAPIVAVLPDGRRAVDYRRFHEVVEGDESAAETPRRTRRSRQG